MKAFDCKRILPALAVSSVFAVAIPACNKSSSDNASGRAAGGETESTDKTGGTDNTGNTGNTGETNTGTTDTGCSLTANTTATTTLSSYNCPLLTRDTESCRTGREAQGLSGFWLKFSCRVTLTKSGSNVILSSDDQPDYKSYYFNSSDACYESFTSNDRHSNPNKIASQTITMTVPYAPTAAGSPTATPDGVIGLALNGVAIYDNSAAPGDDIYQEAATFDKCEGHPDVMSRYHYHTEPAAITNNDAAFVGILRDGFPVYGRQDQETGAAVTGLDPQGGKTGKTVDSPNTAVYHYHVNLQTNGTSNAYFISKGYYKGTPGSCTGCQ